MAKVESKRCPVFTGIPEEPFYSAYALTGVGCEVREWVEERLAHSVSRNRKESL
jgi:hypothetical protein